MLNYKKILFPIDLSQTSAKIVPHVITVAEQTDAEVHLVYVAKTSEYYREDECDWRPGKCEPGQIITRSVEEFAKEHCPMLKEPKVVTLDGEPSVELLTYIEKAEIDLVIMASSGKSPLGKAFFGSVAGCIIRDSHVPVLFVNPQSDKFVNI